MMGRPMPRMPMWMAAAALLGAACDSADSGPTSGELVREGDPWPALTVRDCEGNVVSMQTLIAENDATYITFGAQWCSACQEEAPIINREIVDGLADRSVGAVQILIEAQPGQMPPQSLCSAWATELAARNTVLVDVDQSHLADFFGTAIATLPLHLITTRDGIIRYKKLGDLPSDIKTLVEGWLP
jgi:hypothetical protein